MCNFGSNGRLGNQLFQMSFLLNYSTYRDLGFSIPANTDFEKAFDLNVKKLSPFESKKFVREHGLEYNENYLLEETYTDFSGYFQSEKYLPFTRNTVSSYFRIKPDVLKAGEKWLKQNLMDPGAFTGVHIRRGDYTTSNGFYAYPPIEYYANAAKSIGNHQVVIFTDGSLSQEEIEAFREFNYKICLEPAKESFSILTMASATVISASTFGWWASYLSGSDKNICPKEWYGPNGPSDREHIFSSHLTRWAES